MKRIPGQFILLLLAAALLVGVITVSQVNRFSGSIVPITEMSGADSHSERRVVAGGDWGYPPFEFLDEDGTPAGFNLEIVRRIAEAMNLEIEISLGPWNEVRTRFEKGELDLLLGMYKTEQRQRFAEFTIPHFISSYGLFVPSGSRIQGLADLSGGKLLVQDGDLAHDYVLEHDTGAEIVVRSEWIDLIHGLRQGEADGALMALVQGMMALHDTGVREIQPVGPPLFRRQYSLAVQKGDAELLALLNEGLNILKMSGEYDQIYERWFGIYQRPLLLQTTWFRILLFGIGTLIAISLVVAAWSLTLQRRVEIMTRKADTARVEAEKANSAKTEFLARVSHELRTPLHGILGISRMLQRTRLDEHQEALLSSIEISSQHLYRIISDLLDVTRINSGKLLVRNSVFTIQELERMIEPLVRDQVENKNVSVRLVIESRYRQRPIIGDKERILQIALNLAENAVRNTDNGEIMIKLSCDETGKRLVLTVSDTGRGIPNELRPSIFQPFTQLQSGQSGLGLGLSIIKSLTELLDGELEFESSEGHGTRFIITLPVEFPEASDDSHRDESADPVTPSVVEADGSNGRVLVAEDEAINRLYLENFLRSAGWDPVAVRDGQEALIELSARSYDVVLMDVRMPNMDGLEATRRLRELEKAGQEFTPVIALTANAYPEDKELCIVAGMNGFLSKPFSENALIQEMLRVARSRPV